MTERERLIELINKYPCMSTAKDCFMESIAEDLADYLLANGAIVQKQGEWLPYQTEETYGDDDYDTWYKCSVCGKDANGRCWEDEWYSYPIKSAYCQNCGAKMLKEVSNYDKL